MSTPLDTPERRPASGRTRRVRRLFLAYAAEGAPRTLARVVTLADEPVLIGREPGEHGLTVPDREASRAHARVEREPRTGAYVINDLSSRHGLYVDGVACARAELHHGSVIRVGGALVVFVDAELDPDELLRPESATLLGESLTMQRVRGTIDRVAHGATSVLLRGEPGVGKALVAAELHAQSGRHGRFVVAALAGLADDAACARLFGDAEGDPGVFAEADDGTLFLDELGALSPVVQARLLRTLASGELRPPGGGAPRRVDVRVVAATRLDLRADVQGDGFRADLLACLAGATIELPPLRARREDILRLADGLLVGHALWRPIAPTAAEALVLHDWPGNVRELRDALHAAVLHAQRTDELRLEHLPDGVSGRVRARGTIPPHGAPPARSGTFAARQLRPSREELLRVLAQCQGDLTLCADYYGKDRRQLHRWLEKEGIDPGPRRGPR